MIYLKNLNKHKKYIKTILNKLFVKELRCKLEKCKFYKTEINFSGFFVGVDRIKIDSAKTKTIKK